MLLLTEDQAHDKRATARGEASADIPDDNRKKTDKAAEKNAQSDKNHVGCGGAAVGIAEIFRRALDFGQGPNQTNHITPVDAAFRQRSAFQSRSG